ncbi:hypothetical protein HYX06_04880 [Candidatus Woesearchaeota archaeon]|nr:hypothetical protein [Candidatus Woesearchaeota archaeon]
MYLFSNMLGVFVFDSQFSIVDEMLFKEADEYQNREEFIKKISSRHKNLEEPDEKSIKKILLHFNNPKYFNDFCSKNLKLTKLDVKNSVNRDNLIIQSIKSIGEIDKAINLLVKRLREWYDLYNPEFSRATESHESFVEEILNNEKSELLKKINVDKADSIGAELGQEDIEPIKSLAHQTYDLYQLRKTHLNYISALMDGYCPNIKAVCDVMVAASLIAHAGSLKRLSILPSSTIQILGAEKALFRHMKTGAKPPRHGIIIGHSLIAKAPDRMHGKVARALADKISIAAKIDYFRGKFIGDRLRKELEEKFK